MDTSTTPNDAPSRRRFTIEIDIPDSMIHTIQVVDAVAGTLEWTAFQIRNRGMARTGEARLETAHLDLKATVKLEQVTE